MKNFNDTREFFNHIWVHLKMNEKVFLKDFQSFFFTYIKARFYMLQKLTRVSSLAHISLYKSELKLNNFRDFSFIGICNPGYSHTLIFKWTNESVRECKMNIINLNKKYKKRLMFSILQTFSSVSVSLQYKKNLISYLKETQTTLISDNFYILSQIWKLFIRERRLKFRFSRANICIEFNFLKSTLCSLYGCYKWFLAENWVEWMKLFTSFLFSQFRLPKKRRVFVRFFCTIFNHKNIPLNIFERQLNFSHQNKPQTCWETWNLKFLKILHLEVDRLLFIQNLNIFQVFWLS
jgi:hypothetical protein